MLFYEGEVVCTRSIRPRHIPFLFFSTWKPCSWLQAPIHQQREKKQKIRGEMLFWAAFEDHITRSRTLLFTYTHSLSLIEDSTWHSGTQHCYNELKLNDCYFEATCYLIQRFRFKLGNNCPLQISHKIVLVVNCNSLMFPVYLFANRNTRHRMVCSWTVKIY